MVVCRDGGCLHVCLHAFELTKVLLTEIALSIALTHNCCPFVTHSSLEHFFLFLVNVDEQLLRFFKLCYRIMFFFPRNKHLLTWCYKSNTLFGQWGALSVM